jgi:transcriptional regulator with XRE-family HTH domain
MIKRNADREFLEALIYFTKREKKITQAQLAEYMGLTPTKLSNILAQRRDSKESERRKAAQAVGYPADEDFLDFGYWLLNGRLPAAAAGNSDTSQPFQAGLEREQIESLHLYRELLLAGGEAVETISEVIRTLARKKKLDQPGRAACAAQREKG